MMSRRQMLMMLTEEPGGLPAEYLQVEYLESIGTQWIDTGYIPDANTCVETYIKTSATSMDIPVFGIAVKDSGSSDSSLGKWYHLTPYNNKWYYGTNGTEGNGGSYNSTIGTAYHIIFNSQSHDIVVNDVTIGNGLTFSSWQNNAIGISARGHMYSASGTYKRYGKFQYYYFKIYENGTLVRDFIPCIRISDSKPGMYDLVGRQFYTNAGTGEFLTDYTIILPDNPTETGAGFFTTASFPLLNQQKITLKYFGIGNRASNVFFDGYTARTSPNQLVYTRDLTANNGEYNLTATRDGTLYIGISRNGTVGSTSAFYIKSILLKIE